MQTPCPDREAVRRDPAARAVLARWRALTGGSAVRDADRPTLLACSGGADSVALALALARPQNAVAHIIHDLRDPAETAAERDGVASLARALGLRFFEAEVTVRDHPGNAEGNARRARYEALGALAWEAGCSSVATAHHADDQLETMLMAALRGAGVRGLAGMPPARPLAQCRATLIRPMLAITREDTERLCSLAEMAWATDPTNADESRLRAGLRHGPLRALRAVRPNAARRAGELAEHLREVADLLETLAGEGVASAERAHDGFRWRRADLARLHPAVLGATLRAAFSSLHGGGQGDSLRLRTVRQATAAIRGTSERRFVWRGAELVVEPDRVVLQRIDP